MTTKTIYVVDEDGATFVFRRRRAALRALATEALGGAVHLTITKATAPKGLRGDALVTWCSANVVPTTCGAQ